MIWYLNKHWRRVIDIGDHNLCIFHDQLFCDDDEFNQYVNDQVWQFLIIHNHPHHHHHNGIFIMSSVFNLELHERMARVSCCETVLVVVVSLWLRCYLFICFFVCCILLFVYLFVCFWWKEGGRHLDNKVELGHVFPIKDPPNTDLSWRSICWSKMVMVTTMITTLTSMIMVKVMVILMMTCVRVDLEFGVGRMGFQGIGHPTKLPWKHPMNSAARFVCQNFKMLKDLSTTFPWLWATTPYI